MRRFIGSLTLATLLLVGGFAAGVRDAAAISGTIELRISCGTNPERSTVTNRTDTPLDLSAFTLGGLFDPRAGDPYRLRGTLGVGQATSFETGTGAVEGAPATLARVFIYNDEVNNEGGRLTTPYGSLSVLCSVGSDVLTVSTPAAPTATQPSAPTATPRPSTPTATTTRPAVTATATIAVRPSVTATATAPRATATIAPTIIATLAPTQTMPAPKPGLPRAGGGGGSSSSIGLGAVFLLAIMSLMGVMRRAGRGRR